MPAALWALWMAIAVSPPLQYFNNSCDNISPNIHILLRMISKSFGDPLFSKCHRQVNILSPNTCKTNDYLLSSIRNEDGNIRDKFFWLFYGLQTTDLWPQSNVQCLVQLDVNEVFIFVCFGLCITSCRLLEFIIWYLLENYYLFLDV